MVFMGSFMAFATSFCKCDYFGWVLALVVIAFLYATLCKFMRGEK